MTASDHGDRGGRAFTARRLLWLLPAAILLLLLTAFAGTSFWLGGQARQHLEQALAAPPGDTPSQPYPFKVSEYRRGFFSSRVVTELTVLPGSSARWRFEHRIFHGPLPLTRISGRNAKPALVGAPLLAVVHSRLLPSGTADQYITRLTAETAITMGGRVETFAQATSPEGAKGYPTWQTLRLHLLYPADLSAMQGELSLRNLTLPQNQPQLELARLSLLFHYHLRDDEGEEQPAAKLPAAKLVDTGQHLVFSGLRLGEKLYEEGSAKLEWRNLDKPALLQLAGLLPHLVPSVLEGHPTITPPMAQTLVEALPRLMARSPTLTVEESRLQTAAGSGGGRLHLAYRQNRNDHRPFHPVMLLSGLEFQLEAAIAPPLLAELAPGRTQDSTKWQQWAEPADPEDDHRQVAVSYRQGELMINGHPRSLRALLRW